MHRSLLTCCLLIAIPLLAIPLLAQKNVPWQMEDSHTSAGLRGIHSVGAGVAWASGSDGTILRTEDGGYLWQTCAVPPDAAKLDFRGVWAWDAQTAVVMSSGSGDLSRVYKTTDGCATWKLLYINPDAKGFWDAIQFWDKDHGVILGDPVDGRFVVLLTNDGGGAWRKDESPDLMVNGRRLGAFAASNSAIMQWFDLQGHVGYWGGFATGGEDGPMVFSAWGSCTMTIAQQFPESCLAAEFSHYDQVKVPLASGTASAGVFSYASRNWYGGKSRPLETASARIFLAVGGDYQKPNETAGTAAWTADGGKSWTASANPPHGYRSAVAWDAVDKAWITVGTNGSDVSYDDGKTWQPLDDGNWNALSLPWVVGPKGRIAKLVSLKVR